MLTAQTGVSAPPSSSSSSLLKRIGDLRVTTDPGVLASDLVGVAGGGGNKSGAKGSLARGISGGSGDLAGTGPGGLLRGMSPRYSSRLMGIGSEDGTSGGGSGKSKKSSSRRSAARAAAAAAANAEAAALSPRTDEAGVASGFGDGARGGGAGAGSLEMAGQPGAGGASMHGQPIQSGIDELAEDGEAQMAPVPKNGGCCVIS